MSGAVRMNKRPGALLLRPRRLAAAAVALAIAGLGLFRPALAQLTAAAAREQFREAGRAYAEGRLPEAARLYEDLIRGQRSSMAVFYNLGNALLRDGRPGLAVLNYRKAWRLAPRDPDIRANMRLALQASGAAEADLSGPEIFFTGLSEREWAALVAGAWWTGCLLLCVAVLVRSRRGLALRLSAAAGAVAVAALLGLWTWHGFDRNPELVVLNSGLSARSEPQDAATARFPLPEGSVVRVQAARGAWVKVPSGQLAGWIPRADCAAVLLGDSSR